MPGKRIILGLIFGVLGVCSSWFPSQGAHAACGAVTCFVVVGSQQQVPQAGLLTFNTIYNYAPMRLLDGTSGVIPAIDQHDQRMILNHHKQHGHTFPVLMDRDNKVANQFDVFGLPVSVFIDEKGVVQEYIKGGLLTEQWIFDVVAKIQKREPIKAASLW